MYAASVTVAAARAQFPITRNCIYFDIANMNSPPLGVSGMIAEFFAAMQQGSASKTDWVAEIEATRRKAATLLGCEPGEIAFVKNTSEGLNIAANAIDWKPGDNVVVPVHEHPNNVFPWLNLRRRGVEVRLAPETGEWVDAELLAPFVDRRTRAVAVADVSFLPGQRNDLAGIAKLCREYGAHLVVDGVQAVGLLDARPGDLGVAMWSASAHKGLLSPHGIGIFYCRRELIPELAPVYAARASMVPDPEDDHLIQANGGRLYDDARRFEIGNFNYSGISAMGAALDLILDIGIADIERHVRALTEYLTERLSERQIRRLGPDDPARQSAICAFNLPGESWVEHFAAQGIILSGRAGAIRVSFGVYNNFAEIDRFIAVLDERMAR